MTPRRATLALLGGVAALLSACGGPREAPATSAPVPVPVQAVRPVRQAFPITVDAFGEWAADSGAARVLTLPQAGEVIAVHVVPGQVVQAAAPLLDLATDPATRAAFRQAEAAATLARTELADARRLAAGRLATTVQVAAARKALADAEASLAASRRLGGAADTATLRAPAAGVVTAINVRTGARIAAGMPLLQFTPADGLVARLGVSPEAATHIHPGARAWLHAVYGAAGVAPFTGSVETVGQAVDPQTHLVAVVVGAPDAGALPAGSALTARIETRRVRAWAVPRTALQQDQQGAFVYQIESGKAHRVDVQVLSPTGSPIGVSGALDPHAPVITLGSYEAAAGGAVACTMPPDGCPKGG